MIMDEKRKESDLPDDTSEWGWKYHHLGIPVKRPLKNERYLPEFKMYISGFDSSSYGIEWVRFKLDADFPEIIKTLPHLAFTVPDLEEALKGKKVILEPNSPSPGIVVAFIEDNGAPIELIQEPGSSRKREGTKEIVYSERIYLTDLRPGDAAELYGYRALNEVYRFQSWFPQNISEAEQFILKHSVNSRGDVGSWKQYGTYLSNSAELIGDCGYHRLSETEAEIGYSIAPGRQRQGFGSETVAALVDHLFRKKGIETVIAKTDPANTPSNRLLRKLGFTVKEHLKNAVEIRGQWVDDLVFELKKN